MYPLLHFCVVFHVFDANACAIVVVIELMKRPEVATETERPLSIIGDQICVRCWLIAARRFKT